MGRIMSIKLRMAGFWIALAIAVIPIMTSAQQVNVSTTLRPPYSALLDDYRKLENKAVIILSNTTGQTQQVRLLGSITNETRGLYIQTYRDFRPAMPITLPPFGSTTVTANPDAMRFLDVGNVDTNVDDALQQTITRTGQLPEGVYRICVEAYEYNTERRLSIPEAGCFNFTLTQADPPVITYPVNGQTLPPELQAVVFNWTPPVGNTAGAIIEYEKVVVPLLPGQDPNDAVLAAREFGAGNPVILRRGMLANTYVRQPADQPFEEGKTYAMQVVANDRNRKLLLRNGGASEVVVFHIGVKPDGPVASKPPPRQVPGIGGPTPPVYQLQNVTGKIHYYWDHASATGGGLVNQNSPQSKSNHPLVGMTVQLRLAVQLQNPEGLSQRLIPGGIIPHHESGRIRIDDQPISQPAVLATSYTGSDGGFSFNVPNLDNINFEWQQGNVRLTPLQIGVEGPGQQMPVFDSADYYGNYRYVLMVGVPNTQYYVNPVQYAVVSGPTVQMPTSYARVKTMHADVRIKDKDSDLNRQGVEVYVLRKKGARPAQVPKDEMSPGNFSPKQELTVQGQVYEIVAKKDSDNQGMARFEHLVFAPDVQPNHYFIYAKLNDFNTDLSLWPVNPVNFKYQFEGGYDPNNPPQTAVMYMAMIDYWYGDVAGLMQAVGQPTSQLLYRPPQSFFQLIEVRNAPPRVYTTVRNTGAGISNNVTLAAEEGASWTLHYISANLRTYLRSQWGNDWSSKLVGYLKDPDTRAFVLAAMHAQGGFGPAYSGTTGPDGRIDIRNIYNPVYFKYVYILEVTKPGFVGAIVRVNPVSPSQTNDDIEILSNGRAYRLPDINLTPLGSMFVRITNEVGDPIAGSAYYTDLATGQNGKIKNSQWYPENDGDYSQVAGPLSVPSGPIHLIVRPSNTDLYMADTVAVNVPEGTQHLVDVSLPYKIHRIHFRITNADNQPIPGAKVRLMNTEADLFSSIDSPYLNAGSFPIKQFRQVNVTQTLNRSLDIGGESPKQMYNAFDRPKISQQPTLSASTDDPYLRIANEFGRVDFAFKSSANNFDFRVYGPDGSQYVTKKVMVGSVPSKSWKIVNVELDRGRLVEGVVTIDEAPVEGARVRYTYQGLVHETFTDAVGAYTLNRVPADTMLAFTASKPGFLGMTYQEGLPNNLLPPGYSQLVGSVDGLSQITQSNSYGQAIARYGSQQSDQRTEINFRLSIYGELDFSQLMGFPLEVTEFEDLVSNPGRQGISRLPLNQPRQSGALALISGLVDVNDSANDMFKMTERGMDDAIVRTIDFHDKQVGKGTALNSENVAYARPTQLPMHFNKTQVDLGIYPNQGGSFVYRGSIRNALGVVLRNHADASEEGAVGGRLAIHDGSFNDNNFGFLEGQELFGVMAVPAEGVTDAVNAFRATGASPIDPIEGLYAVNQSNQGLRYLLHGFEAQALIANSRIRRESLTLDTRLNTNLLYVENPNMNLDIGVLTLDMVTRTISPTETPTNFQIPLGGGFRVIGNVLKINPSGIQFDGSVDVKSLSMDFAGAHFRRYQHGDMFEIPDGSLQVDDLTLLGVKPIQVNRPASFGYDAVGWQAWALVIAGEGSYQNPVASISTSGLDGFEPNRTIPLSAVRFYSSGLEEVQLYNGGNYGYRVYDIADFTVQNVFMYDDSFKFSGALNLGIPNFPVYATSLGYNVAGNSLSNAQLEGFYMDPIEMNGIVLRFNPDRSTNNLQGTSSNSIVLTPGRIEIRGALSDENPDVFRDILYTLVKTNQSTRLDIDRNPIQSMPLGGSTTGSRMILGNIEGNMVVQNGQWNHLFIAGDMPEEMGFTADGKRMRFDVMGYLSASNQEVKLSDIETPFGDIQLHYDLTNHRLSGQLNVSGGVSNGPTYNGSAQMVVDRYGFFFMTGLSVSLPSPKIEGMAFMLIGDYSQRTMEMDALMVQYSMYIRKKLEIQVDPMVAQGIYNQLNNNPLAGLNQMASYLGGDFLPETYVNLFGGQRFNGFYFGAGASIPLPIIPNFELDMSPIASFAMGINGGIDVRVGANFGSNSVYTAGFDVFLDAFFGGGASMGVACVYGRIGLLLSVGMDGTFYSSGDYEIVGNADMMLSGLVRAGGGACSMSDQCASVTCLYCEVDATLEFGLEGRFTPNSSNFRIISRVGQQPSKNVYEPPPSNE